MNNISPAVYEFSNMNLEGDELVSLMWAIEVACEGQSDDISERAWAVHERLQAAWSEVLSKISAKNR